MALPCTHLYVIIIFTLCMCMLLQCVHSSNFLFFFVFHIQSVRCGCLALLPAHRWQLRAKSFQGVAERLKGGVQVKQIERVIVECLRFSCGAACAVNTPSPQPRCPHPTSVLSPPTRHSTSPPHTHFILPGLWVEPAQSCQCASFCQPNYRTHLKGGKSSSELPGVAFPLWV